MSHSILDSDVSKFMNTESIDYMQPTAASPVQESLMAPYYPQQQHQNQRQHQIQFPAPTNVPHSAPSSPPFQVKTEEPQQHNMDLFLFQNSFESAQDHHILPSQRSPQMQLRLANQIMHQQHQQKQHQQHQQLKLQHQQFQQQQQIMFETSHSTATSMSIPATASIMVSSASYAPSTIATSTPFYHPSSLSHDDTHTVPTLGYQQRLNAYTPAAHPAAPKRKIEERQPSPPHHSVDAAVAVSTNNLVISEESAYPPMKSSAATTTTSSRLSTSSRLGKVKPTRSTKISKSTPSSSSASSSEMIASTTEVKTAVANKRSTKKSPESRESSEQPDNDSASRMTGTGNITHPRRAAQNRAAQRTFRNRRKAYIKELEQKVQEIDQTRELMESIHQENQEVWRRLQILEGLVRKHELPVPDFAPLVPNTVSNMDFLGNGIGGSNSNGNANGGLMTMMMGLGGSSNEDDEDDEDMSDSFSHLQYQQ
ncbi:hypothetical protein BGX26_013053 [Mortierella sp. AD094]|nr:hypothetical protein BGX26_013053 [Mortierella sp. AD094]